LLYQHETECQVIHDSGTIRFDFDFAREPSGELTGAEFIAFEPVQAAKYYLFNTLLDLQAPPGYVLRTEPHPRFFTEDSGTVPLAMIGHIQSAWYPRLLFVVFRAPGPGQRQVFRKGEPFVQIIFVPERMKYEATQMTPVEAAGRREMEKTMQTARSEIAENRWSNPSGVQFNNHYKVMARAVAWDGMPGLDKVVRDAVARRERSLPAAQTISEGLALGAGLLQEHRSYGGRGDGGL
jgi:hypothetical protein